MGYRKIPTIHTLEFKKYKDLTVRMRGLKIGKMRKILAALDDDSKSTVETVDEMVELISGNLVSWTLEDEDGTPLPANREQVEDLEFDMLTDILSEWLSAVTGPDEELGKDSSDGAQFPGQPLTMELL